MTKLLDWLIDWLSQMKELAVVSLEFGSILPERLFFLYIVIEMLSYTYEYIQKSNVVIKEWNHKIRRM